MLPVMAHHHRSQPAPPPKCPHCQRELAGWSPPSEGGGGCVFALTFFAGAAALVGVVLFALFTVMEWADPRLNPALGAHPTLAHVAAEHLRFVVELLHRIW